MTELPALTRARRELLKARQLRVEAQNYELPTELRLILNGAIDQRIHLREEALTRAEAADVRYQSQSNRPEPVSRFSRLAETLNRPSDMSAWDGIK